MVSLAWGWEGIRGTENDMLAHVSRSSHTTDEEVEGSGGQKEARMKRWWLNEEMQGKRMRTRRRRGRRGRRKNTRGAIALTSRDVMLMQTWRRGMPKKKNKKKTKP